MKKFTFSILILGVLITACKKKPMEFQKLQLFSKIDTLLENGKPIYFKTDVYIVKNYTDNLENEKTVDSFAYRNKALDLSNFSDYSIIFYKESDFTDAENLANNPKDFETYSLDNDMIYIYRWGGGAWSSKTKFKGRETVEGQPMIRED